MKLNSNKEWRKRSRRRAREAERRAEGAGCRAGKGDEEQESLNVTKRSWIAKRKGKREAEKEQERLE